MQNILLSTDSNLRELVRGLATQDSASRSGRVPASRSSMVTDMARVPTSEHVAQIVGKSGNKIKYLRASTNTCIKTPIRGDEPVFTITGQPEDVRRAKLAIEHASQHFTELMASRSNNCAPGEVTIQVFVPQQYVGVVVGRSGSVIIKIKEQTNTRINTPKNDVMPTAFEVTGSKVNVIAAKEAIEERVRQAFQLRSSSCFDPNLADPKRPMTAIWSPPDTVANSVDSIATVTQTSTVNKLDESKSSLVSSNDTIGLFCDNYSHLMNNAYSRQ